MATRRTTKQWDAMDEEFVSFYGLSTDHPNDIHPKFGSAIRFPELASGIARTFGNFVDEKEGYSLITPEDTESFPTLLNWAVYYGYIDWSIIQFLTEKRVKPSTIHDILKSGQKEFVKEHIDPLREYIWRKFQFSFRCIPATSPEAQLVSGEIIHSVGPLVLCLTPRLPQLAQERGLVESELQELAGPAWWILQKRCDERSIKTPKEFLEEAAAWGKLMNPITVIMREERLERMYPHLVTPDVRHVLLDEAQSRLVLLTERAHKNGSDNGAETPQ